MCQTDVAVTKIPELTVCTWAEWEEKLEIPTERRHSARMHGRMFWAVQAACLLGSGSKVKSRESHADGVVVQGIFCRSGGRREEQDPG